MNIQKIFYVKCFIAGKRYLYSICPKGEQIKSKTFLGELSF